LGTSPPHLKLLSSKIANRLEGWQFAGVVLLGPPGIESGIDLLPHDILADNKLRWFKGGKETRLPDAHPDFDAGGSCTHTHLYEGRTASYATSVILPAPIASIRRWLNVPRYYRPGEGGRERRKL